MRKSSTLLVVAGLILSQLSFIAPQASATITFGGVKTCTAYSNLTTAPTVAVCHLNNTTNPNKIVVLERYYLNGGGVGTLTCTEACTCPAGATSSPDGSTFKICYVDTTTTHADFSISLSVTCGGTCDIHIHAYEIPGLASGNDVATSALAQTVNFTTAFANEFVIMANQDFAGALAPASGFSPLSSAASVNANFSAATQTGRTAGGYLLTTTATTYTASFTTTSSSQPAVNVISFQTSGSTIGGGFPLQECSLFLVGGSNPSTVKCRLYNTTSGNVILAGWATNGGVSDNGSTETINFPAGAQICAIGSCNAGGEGYVITTSGHSTFDAGVQVNGGGNRVDALHVQEISGLTTLDSGASAAASATTVNYTTAANNENAYCFGRSNTETNTMVPGNSFTQTMYGVGYASNDDVLMAQNTISTAGSNTFSWTQTGSSNPITSCLAFGIAATPPKGFPMVVKGFPLPRIPTIPFDTRRRKLQIVSI